MKNIHPTIIPENNHEVSPSNPSPFISSARLVLGVGLGVLGVIGKALRGAAGLLVKRSENSRNARGIYTNNSDSI